MAYTSLEPEDYSSLFLNEKTWLTQTLEEEFMTTSTYAPDRLETASLTSEDTEDPAQSTDATSVSLTPSPELANTQLPSVKADNLLSPIAVRAPLTREAAIVHAIKHLGGMEYTTPITSLHSRYYSSYHSFTISVLKDGSITSTCIIREGRVSDVKNMGDENTINFQGLVVFDTPDGASAGANLNYNSPERVFKMNVHGIQEWLGKWAQGRREYAASSLRVLVGENEAKLFAVLEAEGEIGVEYMRAWVEDKGRDDGKEEDKEEDKEERKTKRARMA